MQRKTSFVIPAIIISYSLQFSSSRVFLNETAASLSRVDVKCRTEFDIEDTWLSHCRKLGGMCVVKNDAILCDCNSATTFYDDEEKKCIDVKCGTEFDSEDTWLSHCRKLGGMCVVKNDAILCDCNSGTTFYDEEHKKCIDVKCRTEFDSEDTWLSHCRQLGGMCVVKNDAILCDCNSATIFYDYEETKCIDVKCRTEFDSEDTWLSHCRKLGGMCVVKNDEILCDCNSATKFYDEYQKKCIDVKCGSEFDSNDTWLLHCRKLGGVCVVKNDAVLCDCNSAITFYDEQHKKCIDVKCRSEFDNDHTWLSHCGLVGGVCVVKNNEIMCDCQSMGTFYDEKQKKCVEHCTPGTSSAKECKRLGRNCHIVKQQPFYECRCPDRLIEVNGKCVGYCDNRTKTKEECDRRNRICRSLEEYPFYECKECKDGYIEDGHICSDYCALGKEGKRLCDETHRTCEPMRISPFFLCKECQSGFEENKNGCIRVCERNSTSGVKCKEMKRKCEYTSDYPFYQCGDCEEGLLEFEGLCIQRKTVKEINPLQLLLMKSLKTTEEKQVLVYKPHENGSLFDLSSLLDLK